MFKRILNYLRAIQITNAHATLVMAFALAGIVYFNCRSLQSVSRRIDIINDQMLRLGKENVALSEVVRDQSILHHYTQNRLAELEKKK